MLEIRSDNRILKTMIRILIIILKNLSICHLRHLKSNDSCMFDRLSLLFRFPIDSFRWFLACPYVLFLLYLVYPDPFQMRLWQR